MRLIPLLLVAVLVFAPLSGCGSSGGGDTALPPTNVLIVHAADSFAADVAAKL